MTHDQIDILEHEDRALRALSIAITMMMSSPSQEVRDTSELLDLLMDELYIHRFNLRSTIS